MSKPFDASPKALLQFGPADWPAFVGVKARSVRIVDADVSTVTAATDKVLVVRGPGGSRIQHYEFQSSPDRMLPLRTHWYNGLLEKRHLMPVESIVLLLRPEANLRTITGEYTRSMPGEREPYLRFHYRVIRVWEVPVESILNAGDTVVPLAPISNVSKEELPQVIDRMRKRFATITDTSKVGDLWTATKVLMGLRYDTVFTETLLRGVRAMKESVTYQAIVQEGIQKGVEEGFQLGQAKEARQLLVRIGAKRFKMAPSPEQMGELEGMNDIDQLENLAERVLDVSTWTELLATPRPSRARRRKKHEE